MATVRSKLNFEPRELKFGTSGRRGLVADLTQLEIYITALAELLYLQALPKADGGIAKGEPFYVAYDLRPSSTRFVPEQGGRGEIVQAVLRAVAGAEMIPVNLGQIPTPALMHYATARHRGSMMITGSHIPFDRNGYKTNTAAGELLKEHEQPIAARVAEVRRSVYEQEFERSPFNESGLFKSGAAELPPVDPAGARAYVERYTGFFDGRPLTGLTVLAYQHSAVGRDLLVQILRELGAEVVAAGRSDRFVPIDTENIDSEQLSAIQRLVNEAWNDGCRMDAVVSTDGDSDRPLILGLIPGGPGESPPRVRFFPGDLLGMVVAECIGADAVVVPVSCNDAIDLGPLSAVLEPKTKIGSPYVVAGIERAKAKGRRAVCGWEANGGFLTGTDIRRGGCVLTALPTRDAILPILACLVRARVENVGLPELFARLPRRYNRSALLKNFPRAAGQRIIATFTPGGGAVGQIDFESPRPALLDGTGNRVSGAERFLPEAVEIRRRLSDRFAASDGFGAIARIDYTDGVRITFSNRDVAHLRPSGNADEFRVYATADTQARADAIAEAGTRDPDGIVRRMERAVAVPDVIPITPVVRHYPWGGREVIPDLLGTREPSGKPYAEVWFGAHPAAPARASVYGTEQPLDELLSRAPEEILGPAAARRFRGRLPYLLKVLDAGRMLSIQAHPGPRQAESGFARENRLGIPLDAEHRNYRDENHKPEIHVAVTPFWMLHGFRPYGEIRAAFQARPELAGCLRNVESRRGGTADEGRMLRQLYLELMTMPQREAAAVLQPLIGRLRREGVADRMNPDFWALRAAEEFQADRGLFSIYMLNLLALEPGQGTFQPAGTLHAYLHGATIELMANSDNVLRGGLTGKHVDVEELANVLAFEARRPEVLDGVQVSPAERLYRAPVEDFELSRIQVAAGCPWTRDSRHSADLLIVWMGAVRLAGAAESHMLRRGAGVLVPFGRSYRIEAEAGEAVLFRASIPG
jgi:phosphomannomutase